MTAPQRPLCLVTGASAGIGAALARVYAAHGHNLVLTARRADRLQALAAELKRDFGADSVILPADLSDPAAPKALVDAVAARGLQVDALVNNAGYGLPGLYVDTSWEDQQALVRVLLVAPAELCRRLLPGMIARGSGRILNVASLAGLTPGLPSHTLYGPSKAFLIKMSQALHLEVEGLGVHVTALCPGLTWSEFHDANGTRPHLTAIPRWLWQDAATVAEAGYAACEANRTVIVTGAPNQLIALLARVIPDSLIHALVKRQMKRVRGI
jgi:short-subunit dehydrogenase